MAKEYTREKLIEICDMAIVNKLKWSNRDTAQNMIDVGTCYALLKAGCKFEIKTRENSDKYTSCITDSKTIWIQFWVKDFRWFDWLDADDKEYSDGRCHSDYFFYLPTKKRLESAKGEDWYD